MVNLSRVKRVWDAIAELRLPGGSCLPELGPERLDFQILKEIGCDSGRIIYLIEQNLFLNLELGWQAPTPESLQQVDPWQGVGLIQQVSQVGGKNCPETPFHGCSR